MTLRVLDEYPSRAFGESARVVALRSLECSVGNGSLSRPTRVVPADLSWLYEAVER